MRIEQMTKEDKEEITKLVKQFTAWKEALDELATELKAELKGHTDEK